MNILERFLTPGGRVELRLESRSVFRRRSLPEAALSLEGLDRVQDAFYTYTLPALLKSEPLVPEVFHQPNWLSCLHPPHLPLGNYPRCSQ